MRGSAGVNIAARAFVAMFLAAILATAYAGEPPKDAAKWRIQCDGRARSEGSVVFRVTPHEGTETLVSAKIAHGLGENAVAHEIRDAFRAQLPVERYHIEVDDGEDVLVKKAHGQPDFLVELVSSNVDHLRLHVKHD